MTELTAPRSMHQIKLEHEAWEKRCAVDKSNQAEYEVLKTSFPHIRHDSELLAALQKELQHRCAFQPHLLPTRVAADIRTSLKEYAKEPESTPPSKRYLAELYVDYVAMETAAYCNYRKPASRCEWRKNPDCFADKVKALRATRAGTAAISGSFAL